MGIVAKKPHRQFRSKTGYEPRAHGALCDGCPLAGQRPCGPEGDLERATMAVVSESPGRNETNVGRPFVGGAGVYLNKRLAEAKISRDEVYITHAVACFPPGGNLRDYRADLRRRNLETKKKSKKSKEEPVLLPDPLDCCRPRLVAEVRKIEANAKAQKLNAVIVAAGAATLETLAGKKLSIQKRRGSATRLKLQDG